MSTGCRSAVILQRGRVIGTRPLAVPGRARRGPVAPLVAGPGPGRVALTLEPPGERASPDAIERLRESLFPLVRKLRPARRAQAAQSLPTGR